MNRTRTVISWVAALIALAAFANPALAAGTLDKIRQSGKLALGYRTDAQPFPIATSQAMLRDFPSPYARQSPMG
jgi:hypothetical protein